MSEEQRGEARNYRVLARKYRPARFADLIGQDVLVRTLTNAFAANRLAHAWLLTGVRGVGKTTTARILARALNCVGADGSVESPAAEPCCRCDHCVAIGEDRHVDVLEMDAASRTGVDDVREIVDSVRYAPSTARFKVYIVDEVHMLSTAAFNALLKTLEEPPERVKFVFATTEARKIPVTVLSRCQRFDLRRVDAARLAEHLAAVADREAAAVEADALASIARAADGSVRDGLSLLDQAIGDAAGATVSAAAVRDMLGLADRERVFDLLEGVLDGGLPGALDLLAEQYAAGADPTAVLEDMLALSHWLTRLKLTPDAARDPGLPEAERVRGRALAGKLAVSELTRCWQILLKGLGEARMAPAPLQAAEMVLIRLAHAAALPSPADLVRRLDGKGGAPAPVVSAPSAPPAAPRDPVPPPASPRSFAETVALFADRREPLLHGHLVNDVHLVGFEPGRIELRPGAAAPADLATRAVQCLERWTGRRWAVVVSDAKGADTLREQTSARAAALAEEAARDPLVGQVLATFPGAAIHEVRPVGNAPGENEERAAGAEKR